MGDSELERINREAGASAVEIQNRMIANRLGLLSSMLTGDEMKVRVAPLHDNRIGYIDRTNITINSTRLAGKDINTKFMLAKGLVIHECCHKLFDYSIPMIHYKKAEGLTEGEIDGLVSILKTQRYFYAHNILEDQRIETLLTNLYPNSAPYLRIPIYDIFLNNIKNEYTPEKIMSAKVNALIMLWGRKYVPLNIREGLKNEVMKNPNVEHKDAILKILDLVNDYIQLNSRDVKKQVELAMKFHELTNEMNGIKLVKTENVEDSNFKHRETKQEKKLRDDAEEILKKQIEKENEEQEKKVEEQKEETNETNNREIENTDEEVEESEEEAEESDDEVEENDEKDVIIAAVVADSGLPAGSLTNSSEKDKESNTETNEDSEEQEEQEDNDIEEQEDSEEQDNEDESDEDEAEVEAPDNISFGKDKMGKDNTSTTNIGNEIGDAMVVDMEQVAAEVKMDVRRILETTPPPFTLSYLDIQMSRMLRKKLEQLTSGLQEETAYGQRSGRVHMKSAKTSEITHSTRIFKKKLPDESNKARMAVSILVDGSGSMGSVSANRSKMNVAVRTCFVIANELERMGNFVEVRGFGDNDVQIKAFGQKHADWGDSNWSRTGGANCDTHSSIIAARENLKEISTKEDFQTKVLMLFGDGAWADIKKVGDEITKCNKDGIITVFMKYDEGNRVGYKLQDWEMMNCKLGEYIPVRKINECLVKSVQRIISEAEKEVVKVIMQCRA